MSSRRAGSFCSAGRSRCLETTGRMSERRKPNLLSPLCCLSSLHFLPPSAFPSPHPAPSLLAFSLFPSLPLPLPTTEQRLLCGDMEPSLSCFLCGQIGPERLGGLFRVTSKLTQNESRAAHSTLPKEPHPTPRLHSACLPACLVLCGPHYPHCPDTGASTVSPCSAHWAPLVLLPWCL